MEKATCPRCPGADRALFHVTRRGKKNVSRLGKMYMGYREGEWDKVTPRGQFYDRSTVYKKEIFTAFHWLQAIVLRAVHVQDPMAHPKGLGATWMDVDSKLQHTFRNVSSLSPGPQPLTS